MFSIPEARRLFHIDCFSEMTMKECIINIQLAQGPTLHHNDSQTVRIVTDLTTGLNVSL
jgi:hypothetical protein